MELRATNPALAAQLSLAAYRLALTTETRSSLLSSVFNPYASGLTTDADDENSVALSLDRRVLATTGNDKTVQLWDIHDPHQPSPLGTLTGHHHGSVNAVAFSPDGHTLATASNDDKNTAKLWETDVDSVATQICRNTRTLTASEWDQYFSSLPYRPPCP